MSGFRFATGLAGAVLASFCLAAPPGAWAQDADADFSIRTGHFTQLDTAARPCGDAQYRASRAVFVDEDTGQALDVAVVCLEQQFVVDGQGNKAPLRVGERRTVALDADAPVPNVRSPFPRGHRFWFLTSILE